MIKVGQIYKNLVLSNSKTKANPHCEVFYEILTDGYYRSYGYCCNFHRNARIVSFQVVNFERMIREKTVELHVLTSMKNMVKLEKKKHKKSLDKLIAK